MRRLVVGLTIALILGLWLTPVAVAEPQLTVTSPVSGSTITGPNVTIAFRVTDFQLVPTDVPIAEAGRRPEVNRPGQGHLHFMLDTRPLVVWEQAGAYTFTDVPAGEHQLIIELVQNDHGPLDPPVSQTIRFRTATLMAAAGAGPVVPPWAGLAVASLFAGAAGITWRRWRRR